MNAVRAIGLLVSALRHPMQAARDVASAFNALRGLNVCLENNIVSRIGIHYGNVVRIPGTSASPFAEHGIATMNAVPAKNPIGGRFVATLRASSAEGFRGGNAGAAHVGSTALDGSPSPAGATTQAGPPRR